MPHDEPAPIDHFTTISLIEREIRDFRAAEQLLRFARDLAGEELAARIDSLHRDMALDLSQCLRGTAYKSIDTEFAIFVRRSLQAALDAELFGLWLQVRTKAVSLSQPTATAHGEIHSAAQPGPYLAPYFKADGRLAERLVVAVLARTRAEAMQLFPSLVERLSDDCLRRVTSVTLSSALYPNRRPRGLESRTYAWRELYGIAVADRVDVVGIEKRYQKRGEAFSSRAMELLRDAIADTWIASRTIEILRTVFLAMPTLRDRDITIEQLPEEIDRILRSSFESDGTSDEDPTT